MLSSEIFYDNWLNENTFGCWLRGNFFMAIQWKEKNGCWPRGMCFHLIEESIDNNIGAFIRNVSEYKFWPVKIRAGFTLVRTEMVSCYCVGWDKIKIIVNDYWHKKVWGQAIQHCEESNSLKTQISGALSIPGIAWKVEVSSLNSYF